MNYTEIKEISLAYADREDEEVISKIDTFLRVVEAKLNRELKVRQMSVRTVTTTSEDQEYFSLPPEFGGIRDIEIKDGIDSTKRLTGQYLAPEMFNKLSGKTSSKLYYTFIANQLQITPPQKDKILELIYYKKVPRLDSANASNWISEDYPDCYIFGVLAEISAFVKSRDAFLLWDERYKGVVDSMINEDSKVRWSGPALITIVE